MSTMSRKIHRSQHMNDADREREAQRQKGDKPWYRKAFKPMDYLIALIAIYLFGFSIDYSNMGTIEIVYCVCFGVWFIMLAVRGYIYYTGRA